MVLLGNGHNLVSYEGRCQNFWKHTTVATCCCNSKSSSRALTRDKEYSAWMKRGLSKKCTYGTGRIVQVRTINFDGFFLVMFSLLLRVLSHYKYPQSCGFDVSFLPSHIGIEIHDQKTPCVLHIVSVVVIQMLQLKPHLELLYSPLLQLQ